MIAYIDSSVLMRIVLRDPNPLAEWNELRRGVASELLKVESHRTLDRLWHLGKLTEDDLAEKRSRLNVFMTRIDTLPLSEHVLDFAARPLPTILATLDAIHLATALLYRATQSRDESPLLFATHDYQLAAAARAVHFEVIGA